MKGRQLKLDGLDAIRERLDQMALALPGWQFQIVGAPEPHPLSALQVEGYCPELKKQAGIVLHEEHIIGGEWSAMLHGMEIKLARHYN